MVQIQKVIQCVVMWSQLLMIEKSECLVIFSVKKDANLSAREDVGGEEGRIVVGLR